MEKIYNFYYKGKVISYSGEQFRKIESRFKEHGRNIYRIFCSKINAVTAGKNLEAISCC